MFASTARTQIARAVIMLINAIAAIPDTTFRPIRHAPQFALQALITTFNKKHAFHAYPPARLALLGLLVSPVPLGTS